VLGKSQGLCLLQGLLRDQARGQSPRAGRLGCLRLTDGLPASGLQGFRCLRLADGLPASGSQGFQITTLKSDQ